MLWLQKGRDGDPAYLDLLDRVKAAEARGEDEIVQILRGLAKTSVPACIFLLSRRNPKAWGDPAKAVASEAKPGDVPHSPEELLSLLDSLTAAARSATG